MNIDEVMSRLESLSDPDAVAGMARYGMKPERALGISIPKLRKLAGELRGDHALALELWASGVHEARILAGMVDDPALVSERQMEEWTSVDRGRRSERAHGGRGPGEAREQV